ncbi:MAG: hypothetical protein NXI24_04085 [bacterium]|nr:hypothetical protein [bacterium]
MSGREPKYFRAREPRFRPLRFPGGRALLFACAVFAGLLAPASAVLAQALNLQAGGDTGNQIEKFPTPRDPSYVPPLLSQSTLDSANETELGGSALVFSGGGGDLVSLFAERRAAQLEAARRADRYGERNAQYLDQTGQDRALLEQNLQRQFGSARGLPRDFGKSHYTETPARRFSVVFFLSLPITAGVVGGLYQAFGPGVVIDGPADYPALLGILGAGSVFSALIGYYDYKQTYEARAHAVGHRAREAYELRNHPFGPRGVKDPLDSFDTLDAQAGEGDSSFWFDRPDGPTRRVSAEFDGAHGFLYVHKAWRTAAADDARRSLRSIANSKAGRAVAASQAGGAGNFRADDPARLLNFRWRFTY